MQTNIYTYWCSLDSKYGWLKVPFLWGIHVKICTYTCQLAPSPLSTSSPLHQALSNTYHGFLSNQLQKDCGVSSVSNSPLVPLMCGFLLSMCMQCGCVGYFGQAWCVGELGPTWCRVCCLWILCCIIIYIRFVLFYFHYIYIYINICN